MLELKRLNKTFNRGTINETRALTDLSLQVQPGSFVVLLGGNGSGKSKQIALIENKASLTYADFVVL